ncbi:MAG: hypothetical protein CMC70_10305 [Flavobacteriaceae bacterium]|nr:hypothetical protein [Flavobacteriaceae bacterium]
MTKFKKGQIVKFHTPFPEEDPQARYIILEVTEYKEDRKMSRALVKSIGTKIHFVPTHVYLLDDLEIDEGLTRCLKRYVERIENGELPEVEFWKAMKRSNLP